MVILTPIVIDFIKPDPLPVVNAKQGDTGRGVRVTITMDGQICQLTSEEVNIFIRKPDGKLIYNRCTIQGGDIIAMFTNQALAVPGRSQVELEVLSGEEKISTPIAFINVLPTNIEADAIESTNEFERYETIIAEVKAAEVERENAENTRVTAENARVEAENERVTAEYERADAESERLFAEEDRKGAEALRAQAEELRRQAEAARAAAEELREAAKLAAEMAARAANEAAEKANNAADMRGVVAKSGDTMTGPLVIEGHRDDDIDDYFTAWNADTGLGVAVTVSPSGELFGLYDINRKKWMIYGNIGGETYLNGLSEHTKYVRDSQSQTNISISYQKDALPASELGYLAAWNRVSDTEVELRAIRPNDLYVGIANKLGAADKGLPTQPIHLVKGVPTACTYKLEKSVPSNAVFTDTNTWRPVDNTLESQATDRSLSAKMGYLLNQNLGNINRDLGNRAHMYRTSWGKSLTIPGLAHGIIIVANHTIYGIWVAGSAGAYELSKLFLHGYDTLTFSCNRTTGAVTVTCKETSGITYIGA